MRESKGDIAAGSGKETSLRVHARCLGILRDWVGAAALDLDAATVADLLDALRRMPAAGRSQLFDSRGQRSRWVEVLVNGHNIRFLAGEETPLAEGDLVTLFVHASWCEVPFM